MQRNDAVTIRKDNPVNLNLDDVDLELWGTLKLNHFELIVKVANVSDNGIVLFIGCRVMVLKLLVVVTEMSISSTTWSIVATW